MYKEYKDLQLSNSWFDENYRIAQSRLFITALKARKQFLYENRQNLKTAIEIWNKQKEGLIENKVIVAAWNWINIAIPVISSTFSSFSYMFKNMGEKTLGYLFIDEAGQAIPQASIGAIYRSRHIMVVGDPAQIKPVLTLDSSILGQLRERFCVSEKYLSDSASTQTLADRASQYGFFQKSDKSDDSWIGIPLWVHRRCNSPMFEISNTISYKGFMVHGAPAQGKAEWYDVQGKADDKYVKEQGDFLLGKIQEMIEKNPNIINKTEEDIIYVITPFTNVTQRLIEKLEKSNFVRRDEKKKATNVGTVHTFQGKEAPIVFLVLGADNNSRGAATWAVSEPNIINVAASRAKNEFYIIGDKNLYLSLNCPVINKTFRIIDKYNRSPDSFMQQDDTNVT